MVEEVTVSLESEAPLGVELASDVITVTLKEE